MSTADGWTRAELIPTAGIKGAEEQERRATSALLAVLGAVKEFGRAFLKPLGAPSGSIETFIEVPFDLDGQTWRPDGLIRVSRGKKTWTGLVETKTGDHALGTQQVEAYLDIAKQERFDAVVTISNELGTVPEAHPTPVDGRKLRGTVGLHHYSWTEILTQAVLQRTHRGVEDDDQAWILGELIRYLEHPRSGVVRFADMGPTWVKVRDGARSGSLRGSDAEVASVATRWDQLVQYLCLHLGRALGADVEPALTRTEAGDPGRRAKKLKDSLQSGGVLTGRIRVPDAVGPVAVKAELRARQIEASLTLGAPKKGRSRTRVNWLVRQLKDAPPDLRLDAYVVRGRGVEASAHLGQVRESPELLVKDPKREITQFGVALVRRMGLQRASGRDSFVGSVVDLVDDFYGSVVEHLSEWKAPPPKLKREEAEQPRELSEATDQVEASDVTAGPEESVGTD